MKATNHRYNSSQCPVEQKDWTVTVQVKPVKQHQQEHQNN